MQGISSQAFIDRMIGAAKLDIRTYEEVEHDTNATAQALVVVVLASIAAGIGSLRADGFSGLVGGIVASVIGWAVFSVVVYFIGTRLLATSETQADPGQVLRTLGFANAPRILYIVGFIPILGWLVVFLAGIWFIVASVVAIRQALEMSTARAIATGVIALIPAAILTWIILAIFNISGPGTS